MTWQALSLVLMAACLHATWNLLAKRAAKQSTVPFIWLCSVVSAAIYTPVVIAAVLMLDLPLLDRSDAAVVLGSGVLHIAYFILLQRGYRAGDMSLVYPLARGSGPLFTVIAAMLFFGEQPGVLALCGILCIICGIFVVIGLRIHHLHRAGPSAGYGLATGAAIAAYTLWDKHAVSALALSPLVYDFGRNVVQAALLAPLNTGKGQALLRTWRAVRWEIIGIAALSPLAYILVLTALVTTPVSLVAPAREISIVIGAFLGARYFAEGHAKRRIIAAALMFAGIVAIAAS